MDPPAAAGRCLLFRRGRRISDGKAVCFRQRVEDNAFHLHDKSRRLFAARFSGGDFGEIWWEIICGECLDIHFDQAHEWAAEIRFSCAASIYNYADSRDDAAMRTHDVDCLLHAASACDDVFDHDEFLVRRNLKTAAQNEIAVIFFDKDMAFA